MPKSIPIINISPLFSDNLDDYKAVDQAIGKACTEAGAFVASHIPKPVKPDEAQTKKLLNFFNLDQEILNKVGTRRVNPDSPHDYRGYTSAFQNDWKRLEIYDIGPKYDVTGPSVPKVEQLVEPNLWPDSEPEAGWQSEMESYFNHMHDFSKRLMRSIIRFLQMDEDSNANRFDYSNSTLRLLNYPPLPEGQKVDDDPELLREFEGEKLRIVIKEHKDQCCLSLLWQSAVGGLQMQSPSGEWQVIPKVEDGISIHIGMAMEHMTDNKFAATPHRVIGKEGGRQSIGFFFEPNLHSTVKPFSKEPSSTRTTPQDSYAALLLQTFAEREAKQKEQGNS